MENASKALILTGAVLIAIILISLGGFVISSQKGTIDASVDTGDVTEKSIRNSQFQKYSGKQKGSALKALYSEIAIYNAKNPSNSINFTVDSTKNYNKSTSGKEPISTTNYNLIGNLEYTIEVSDSNSDGYVDTIKIIGYN